MKENESGGNNILLLLFLIGFCLSCTLQNSVEKKKILAAFDLLKAALSVGEHQSRKLVRNNNLKLHIKCYVAMTATSCYSRTFVSSPAVESHSPDLLFSVNELLM